MSDETTLMPIAATRAEVAAEPQVVARVLRQLGGYGCEVGFGLFSF